MGLLNKKVRQIQNSDTLDRVTNFASDKAVEIIKNLGGTDKSSGTALIDNYVVFTSSDGGTGVSTIACNVAYTASNRGLKVLVIDLNILKPMQHIFLGVKREVNDKPDLVSYILGKSKLGDSIVTNKQYSLMFANNRNLADSINCNSDTAIENFNNMISKLRKLYDLIIVDCPMRLDNMLCNNVLYNCDTMYMVWDDGMRPIAHTDDDRRNMSYCGIDAYTKMKIILNKRTYIHYSKAPFTKLNLDLIETLPFDVGVIESEKRAEIFCDKGTSHSKNSAEFEFRIAKLTDKILRIGGLINGD